MTLTSPPTPVAKESKEDGLTGLSHGPQPRPSQPGCTKVGAPVHSPVRVTLPHGTLWPLHISLDEQ